MTTPNVIIAGTPKCGTTSTFDWLSDHPEVSVSTIKEVCFFMDKDYPLLNKINYNDHGIKEYHSYFDHCKNTDAKVILEATPHYLYQQTALDVLPTLTPCPQIIFILRKPSDKIYSSYQFTQNNLAVLDKHMTFKKFISLVKTDPSGVLKDRILLRNVIEHSKYVQYISSWIDRFGSKNIHVFLFEHLREDPVKFMKHMSQCVGIDDLFWDHYTFIKKNETFQVKNQKFHRVKKMCARFLPEVIKEGLKQSYYQLNVEEKLDKSEDDRETLDMLDRDFSPYNDKLAGLLNIDLSVWNKGKR